MMQAEHIQIMKLMHDIADLSDKHNITVHDPIGNYRLKVESKLPYRFGSVTLESYKVYDYGTTKKKVHGILWQCISVHQGMVSKSVPLPQT